MPPRRHKYDRLVAALAALPAEHAALTLSFADLHALIGGRLPLIAAHQFFWVNSAVARRNWQAAGFTASLTRFPGEPRVAFRRVTA